MNQNVQKLHDDMYDTIDDFVNEQCTYFGDENNCKSTMKHSSCF